MPRLNDATALRLGTVPVVAVYAGTVKVWPTAVAPPLPDMQAQDDGEHRVMIWDHYWADVPVYPDSALVAVTLSPVYRQTSVPSASVRWIDAASASQPIVNVASGTNLTEAELLAMVDGPGIRVYTRYALFFCKDGP